MVLIFLFQHAKMKGVFAEILLLKQSREKVSFKTRKHQRNVFSCVLLCLLMNLLIKFFFIILILVKLCKYRNPSVSYVLVNEDVKL